MFREMLDGNFACRRERREGQRESERERERKCMRDVHFDNDILFYNSARRSGSNGEENKESESQSQSILEDLTPIMSHQINKLTNRESGRQWERFCNLSPGGSRGKSGTVYCTASLLVRSPLDDCLGYVQWILGQQWKKRDKDKYSVRYL